MFSTSIKNPKPFRTNDHTVTSVKCQSVTALTDVRFSVDLHWDAFSYHQLLGRAKQATDLAWERALS